MGKGTSNLGEKSLNSQGNRGSRGRADVKRRLKE